MNKEIVEYFTDNDNWYINLKKAPWSPPNYLFGIVWPILYFLMAISYVIISQEDECIPYCNALTLFIIQLGLNLIWTTIFFKYKKTKLALLDLILIIIFTVLTIKEFYKINKKASYLLIPYILWLFLALSLNVYIVLHN